MKQELFRKFLGETRSEHENLTQNERDAKFKWQIAEDYLKQAGREGLLENPTILDVGGGMGEMSAYLNQRGGWKCVSLDDDRSIPKKEGALQVRGDAGQLPFGDASFDIVYEKGMFDAHLYEMNWKKIIPEIHRVLKPKGVLCIVGADHPPHTELQTLFTLINPGKSIPVWEKK